MMFGRRGEAPSVLVAARAGVAPDAWASRALRAAAMVALGLGGVIAVAGGTKAVFSSAPSGRVSWAQNGPSVEARELELAGRCVRDLENTTPTEDAGAVRDRVGYCYPAGVFPPGRSPLDGWAPAAGSQVAVEPWPVVVARTADGLTATVVVRLRVSGPAFAYYTVDVGCRGVAGPCSLTTLPQPVPSVDGHR